MIVKTLERSIVRISLLRPPPPRFILHFTAQKQNDFSQQHKGLINKDTY